MTSICSICKKLRLPNHAGGRAKKVLLRALALCAPALIANLIIQGCKEFQPELEARKKYKRLIQKTIRKG